jgi:hypothetical protein
VQRPQAGDSGSFERVRVLLAPADGLTGIEGRVRVRDRGQRRSFGPPRVEACMSSWILKRVVGMRHGRGTGFDPGRAMKW